MPTPRTWTDEQLIAAVGASRSMKEVHTRLGLSGSHYEFLRSHCERLGLDHTKLGWHGRLPVDDVEWARRNLVEGTHPNGVVVRMRLVRMGLWRDICHRCGISEWQGEPAPLQVDHLDGNGRNNHFANLVLLCANCHCLTPTWGRRPRAQEATDPPKVG